MPHECFGLIGGLGVGAAVHYYKELAKAGPLDLVMVHADMPRMVRWAEAGDARSMAEYVAGLVARLQAAGATFAALPAVTPHLCIHELLPISPLPLVNMLEVVAQPHRLSIYNHRLPFEFARRPECSRPTDGLVILWCRALGD